MNLIYIYFAIGIVITILFIDWLRRKLTFTCKSRSHRNIMAATWPLQFVLLVLIWPIVVGLQYRDWLKLPILIGFLFTSILANGQSLKQVDIKNNLPVYQIQKDSIGDAIQIGYVKQGAIDYPLYQRNKPKSKNIKTCFYFTVRTKATKTQTVGQWYKKTCDCPKQ